MCECECSFCNRIFANFLPFLAHTQNEYPNKHRTLYIFNGTITHLPKSRLLGNKGGDVSIFETGIDSVVFVLSSHNISDAKGACSCGNMSDLIRLLSAFSQWEIISRESKRQQDAVSGMRVTDALPRHAELAESLNVCPAFTGNAKVQVNTQAVP